MLRKEMILEKMLRITKVFQSACLKQSLTLDPSPNVRNWYSPPLFLYTNPLQLTFASHATIASEMFPNVEPPICVIPV